MRKRYFVVAVSAAAAALIALVALVSPASSVLSSAPSSPALAAVAGSVEPATELGQPAAAKRLVRHSSTSHRFARSTNRGAGILRTIAASRPHASPRAKVTPFGAGIGTSSPLAAAIAPADGGPIAHAASVVTITAATSGSGSASVTDNHVGCSGRTSCNVFTGDSISISESPSSGNRFNGSSGGTCSGTSSPCTFSATKTETDTANFVSTATVAVNTSGSGSGTVSLTDSSPLANCKNVTSCLTGIGDSVTLTVTPASGSRFTGWSGGSHCSGTTSPCTFTTTGAETYTANFAKTVTVTAATSGSGTATLSDSDSLAGCTNVTSCLADVGDKITINATASSGNRFTGWSGGSCSGTTTTCVISSLAAAETDTANFTKTITITSAVTGSGTATITDSDSLAGCTNVTSCLADVGDKITITATATSGNRLSGWSGGTCTGTATTCVINSLAAAETDTANFTKTITSTTATSGSGTATITDSDSLAGCTNVTSCLANVGDKITINATASSGNRFTGWSGGTCSGTATTCVINSLAAAETDTANFAKTITVSTAVTGSGTATLSDSNSLAGCTNVTSCLADTGDTITITATAASGNRFSGWSGGTCSGTATTCVINSLAAAETDTANFTKTITITTATSGSGTATITDSDSLAGCTNVTSCLANVGDKITINATASSGNRFTGWSGGTCSGTAT